MASGTLHQVGSIGGGSPGLRRLGTVLAERAWLILLCVALGGAVGLAYLWRAPKTYAATAVVKYQADQLRLLEFSGPQSQTGAAALEQQLAALHRMLSSTTLLRSVAESQQLSSQPRFGGGESGAAALERAVKILRRRLQVEVPANDVVINVSVRDSSPDTAANLANAVVRELLAEYTRNRDQLLKEVSARLEAVLKKAQEEFRTGPTLTNAAGRGARETVPSQGQLAVELTELIDRIAKEEIRLVQLDANLAAVQKEGTNLEALVQVPAVASASQIKVLRDAYLTQRLKFDQVTQRYKEKMPAYQDAKQELDRLTRALAKEIEQLTAQLRGDREQAQVSRDRLRKEYQSRLADLQQAAQPAGSVESETLVDQVKAVSGFYTKVMERLKELNLTGDLIVSPLRVTAAVPPTTPEGPQAVWSVGYGLAGGLVAGLLICLVFGLGDTSLKSVDETERLLALAVLGVVPKLRDSETEMAAAEGFRSLRTSIAVSSKGKEPRLLLFTSTSPDEGKTFCALNFAVGLAQQGHKTVLIECDLRRPMAAPSLSLVKVDGPGVSDFLKSSPPSGPGAQDAARRRESGLSFAEIRRKKGDGGEVSEDQPAPAAMRSGAGGPTLEEVVQRTEVANLFFVAAGKPVANPTELLSRPRFDDLLNGLLQRYDRVILDSAPVLGVSESLLLASRVQGVCFVVRGDHTPRRAILRAVEILRRADAPLIGVILNGVNPKHSDPYGQDYYYHRSSGQGA